MKPFVSRILLAVGILLLGSVAASAQVLPPFSFWQNDKTSILNVWSVSGNQFSGFFTNRAQGYKCQYFPYPMAGTILPNGAITFVVNFTDCNTVTTWRGRVMGSRIATKWSLIYRDNNVVPHRMTGADMFTKQ